MVALLVISAQPVVALLVISAQPSDKGAVAVRHIAEGIARTRKIYKTCRCISIVASLHACRVRVCKNCGFRCLARLAGGRWFKRL